MIFHSGSNNPMEASSSRPKVVRHEKGRSIQRR
jgi:hypothetical protein